MSFCVAVTVMMGAPLPLRTHDYKNEIRTYGRIGYRRILILFSRIVGFQQKYF
jgi:hypothetical protein